MANTNLVAYFSHRGMNYVSGKIKDLKVGNTEVVANEIRGLLQADIFHIQQDYAYPFEYDETTKVAQAELQAQARPTLTNSVDNMEQYDTVYLGYPNWWGTMPMAVATFLQSYDFANKTIIPFCTHEGSGMGGLEMIQKLCPNATVQYPVAIRGSDVHSQQTKDTLNALVDSVKEN